MRLTGTVVPFDTITKLWPGMYERIMPGAFSKVILAAGGEFVAERGGTVANINHDDNKVYSRIGSGLILRETKKGLEATIDVADVPAGREVFAGVQNNLLTAMSFRFVVKEESSRFDPFDDGTDYAELRTITEIAELQDVAAVVFPAYTGTELAIWQPPTAQEEAANLDMDDETRKRIARGKELLASLPDEPENNGKIGKESD